MKKVILLFFVTLLLSGCNRTRQEQGQEDDDVTIDLPQLKAQGEITAVTLYSSTSYFQYKMQPMGYEYELIKDFARSEGLKLNIKVAESPTKLIEMLEAGEADVVAYPIQISNRLKDKLIYCGQEEQDCQVLIQRANKGDKIITDVTELLGKDVYVKPGTKYFERLKNLDVELGGGIRIHEADADTGNDRGPDRHGLARRNPLHRKRREYSSPEQNLFLEPERFSEDQFYATFLMGRTQKQS